MSSPQDESLENIFPKLKACHFRVTSPLTDDYNCVAWSVGIDDSWWWPDPENLYYWPPDIPRERTLSAFKQAYSKLEYAECDSDEYEEGHEKIAIFVDQGGRPTHVARQLQNTLWTSKLGWSEDIEHDLEGLEGDIYGRLACFLKRKLPTRNE